MDVRTTCGGLILSASLVLLSACAAPKHRVVSTPPRPMPEVTENDEWEGVDSAIARERWRFKNCFDHALAGDPSAAGTYHVRVEVGATGAVTGVWMASSSGTESLGTCVAGALSAMTFPPPPGGRAVFEAPVVFSVSRPKLGPMTCASIAGGDEECDTMSVDGAALQTLASRNLDHVVLVLRSGAQNDDLRTIRKLPALKRVVVRAWSVTDLTVLGEMKQLESVDVQHTQAFDITFVRVLPHLSVLRLPPTADLTPAFDVPTLRELALSSDPPTWTPLARLQQLERFEVVGTQLVDLSPLAASTKIRALRLIDAKNLTSIAALAGLNGLEELTLVHTSVSDLSPLRGSTKLRMLDLRACRGLSDITPLAKLPSLEEVNLGGTKVKELWPLLASAKRLKHLVVPKSTSKEVRDAFRAANPALAIE